MSFKDHFSTAAADYAGARPTYPRALFTWIASVSPTQRQAWEPGCGSGQASCDLAQHFDAVFATDPSAAQIAQASAPGNVTFAVEPGERCGLPDACVDAVCVAQALHWFDRAAFFAECDRVLKPGGVLVAWGYQDVVVPSALAAVNAQFQDEIRGDWPAERALVDSAYAEIEWPFEPIVPPRFTLQANWPLPRLLSYFSSYSAVKQYRQARGSDPVAAAAPGFAEAWHDSDATLHLQWPLFVHARRKRSG